MSQTLTLELADEVCEAVQRAAAATGVTPTDRLLKGLGQRFGGRDDSAECDEQPLERQFSKGLVATVQAERGIIEAIVS